MVCGCELSAELGCWLCILAVTLSLAVSSGYIFWLNILNLAVKFEWSSAFIGPAMVSPVLTIRARLVLDFDEELIRPEIETRFDPPDRPVPVCDRIVEQIAHLVYLQHIALVVAKQCSTVPWSWPSNAAQCPGRGQAMQHSALVVAKQCRKRGSTVPSNAAQSPGRGQAIHEERQHSALVLAKQCSTVPGSWPSNAGREAAKKAAREEERA